VSSNKPYGKRRSAQNKNQQPVQENPNSDGKAFIIPGQEPKGPTGKAADFSSLFDSDAYHMTGPEQVLPLGRKNYIFIAASIALVMVGFLLMGGEFKDRNEFSVSLYIAPVVVLSGFGLGIYALMVKSDDVK
jgi:hypothetical protein